MSNAIAPRKNFGLQIPGRLTVVGWEAPKNISQEQWLACGAIFGKIETGYQWWTGDWWTVGEDREWGEGEEVADKIGINYQTVKQYGSVASAFELCDRSHNLTFTHHLRAMAEPDPRKRLRWLAKAEKEGWSSNQLKAAIARQAALDKTRTADLDAAALGKFAVLYADPPWQYEHPPMGGSIVRSRTNTRPCCWTKFAHYRLTRSRTMLRCCSCGRPARSSTNV